MTDSNANVSIATHLVVTPARNEAENLRRLGECLIEQTWRPDAWIVVDNGSTDGTADVVTELARAHGWIRLVSIASDAVPARGRSSVRAFNAGVMDVPKHPDLITGLDADVSFESGYFEALRREFERNPRLGIASGLCYEPSGEGWEPVHVTHPYIRGASFTCRRECVAQLLPLEERLGWESIAVLRANVRGWTDGDLPQPQLLPPSPDRCPRRQPIRELRGGRGQRVLHVVQAFIHVPPDALPRNRPA